MNNGRIIPSDSFVEISPETRESPEKITGK